MGIAISWYQNCSVSHLNKWIFSSCRNGTSVPSVPSYLGFPLRIALLYAVIIH